MNKYLQEREELNNLYDAPENRRLKYCAITIIALVIILLLSMTIWIDKISTTGILIMRGCAGLGAIAFVIIVGILSYHVNKQHISNRKNKNR